MYGININQAIIDSLSSNNTNIQNLPKASPGTCKLVNGGELGFGVENS